MRSPGSPWTAGKSACTLAEEPPDAQTVCAGEGGAAAHARTAADGFIAVRRRRRRRRRAAAAPERTAAGGGTTTTGQIRAFARRGTVGAARTDWTFVDDAAVSHYPAHSESHRYRLSEIAMRPSVWRFFYKA